ncbi:MAG TPA: flagellar basal body L-ring protein FlgH [Alphaproteobacteria bacterium]|nr:flagellar basal body L-ring protein FlgH [Alphaproteobacteria bacterium]
MRNTPYFFLLGSLLSACNLAERIATVGENPNLSQIHDPTAMSYYKPVNLPMPNASTHQDQVNSLWQTGSKAFFKDQRAAKVGDVVTVNLDLNETQKNTAKADNKRTTSNKTTVNSVLGYEAKMEKLFPKKLKTPGIIDYTGNPTHNGTGTNEYTFALKFDVAAIVTQVLPNGNLVIMGKQELRLQNELREIVIMGVIRREDITSANAIAHNKIAELRVGYGGRGDVSDYINAPWGSQLLNRVTPF